MAIVGYSEVQLKQLMKMTVYDLPFSNTKIGGRIAVGLERRGIISVEQLLMMRRHMITRIKGFGPAMERELYRHPRPYGRGTYDNRAS